MLLRAQILVLSLAGTLRHRVATKVDALRTDESGEITSTTLFIGVLCALAIAVGGIITYKFTQAANDIPTGTPDGP